MWSFFYFDPYILEVEGGMTQHCADINWEYLTESLVLFMVVTEGPQVIRCFQVCANKQ